MEVELEEPVTRWMLPGSHEPSYGGRKTDCDGWPAMDASLGELVVPPSGGSLTIDVPRAARAVFEVTLAGAAPPKLPEHGRRRPELRLRRDDGAVVALPLYLADGSAVASHERRLFPGSYRVEYALPGHDAWGSEWPLGEAVLDVIEVNRDASIAIDVPRARGRVRVAVDGPIDRVWGAMLLLEGGDGSRIGLDLLEEVDGAGLRAVLDRTEWFLPGRYDVFYLARASGSPDGWPAGTTRLGCAVFRP